MTQKNNKSPRCAVSLYPQKTHLKPTFLNGTCPWRLKNKQGNGDEKKSVPTIKLVPINYPPFADIYAGFLALFPASPCLS